MVLLITFCIIIMSVLKAFAERSVESLSLFLKLKGFQAEVVDSLRDNNVDGATFLRFTRDDLKDIFPTNFQFRKKIWDYLEDIRCEDCQIRTDSSYPKSTQQLQLSRSPVPRMRSTPSSSDSERSSSPLPGTQFVPGMGSTSLSKESERPVSPLSTPPCTQSRIRRATPSNSDSEGSSGPSLVTNQHEKQKSGSRSSSGTEPVIDIEEDYRFYISAELHKCNQERKYPDEKVLRRFIRDAAASLQAVAGENISQSDFVLAAMKICQEVPVLKDPTPASFPSGYKFPYWSTVLYQLKRRVQNVKGYEKRKTQGKTNRSSSTEDVQFGEKEVEELHANLLREVQSKKKNFAAIREIQKNTFNFRRKDIQQMPEKSVVSGIISNYPFFQLHECTLLNELEFYCKMKDGHSVTFESWLKNWMSTSEKVKSCLESHDFIPDDHETELTPDEICGAFMEHVTSIDEKSCSLPLLNILPLQIKSNIDEVIKKETKTNQPSLWCAMDEGILSQAFLVVDKKVFIELSKLSYFNSLLVLMGAYFAFNLSYDRRQELIFQFVEEFVLGLRPSKKSVQYRTLCMLLVPEK